MNILFRYNIPGIFWGLIILILTSIPGSDVPKFTFLKDLPIDKIVHFFMFLIFAFLLIYGFFKQYFFQKSRYKPYIIALTISIVYGALTEVLQGILFVERSSELADFITNVAGSIMGVLIFLWIKKRTTEVLSQSN